MGEKICITKDGEVRPCIYSQISIANIFNDNIERIFEKIKTYWEITKDKVEVCKNCELRYVCFDCREIARIKTNNLYAKNPYCQYNPIKGTWIGK
ncbi:MAG: SPASM domain-containing protein [Promethearchaeota archaeon]